MVVNGFPMVFGHPSLQCFINEKKVKISFNHSINTSGASIISQIIYLFCLSISYCLSLYLESFSWFKFNGVQSFLVAVLYKC